MNKCNVWLAKCSAKMVAQGQAVTARLQEKKGDIPISTLGAILLAVFGVVLAMAALKKYMPGIYNTILGSLSTKLTGSGGLWENATTPGLGS